MPKLILIKHAKPVVTPDLPPEEWSLSDEGRRQAAALAERLRAYGPAAVVCSKETKASETGTIIGDALGISVSTSAGLREHARSTVPQMQTKEFISFMALLFKRPTELVLGEETAEEAYERFSEALSEIERANEGKTVAVVSHGTVLALHLARLSGQDPFAIWRRMGLPSFAVVEGATVVEEVDRI
jgi:broad specificity phosphatase PhoE